MPRAGGFVGGTAGAQLVGPPQSGRRAAYAPAVDFLSGMLADVIELGALALAVWAFVDALMRPTPLYTAADKLTKPAWLGITGGAALVTLLSDTIGIFGLVALVASIVYLVDVRPALREVQRGNPW